MAASRGSGTSSGLTLLTTSGSEEDLRRHAAADLRRQKRKLSNRESARRSRMRKQKHLDDLTAQVVGLRQENAHVLANLKAVTQRHLAVEAENSVLRAQVAELGDRLQSLGEILQYMDEDTGGDGFLMNPWNLVAVNQPIMAAVDFLQY